MQESPAKDCWSEGTGEPLRLVMPWFSKNFNLVTLIFFLMLYTATHTLILAYLEIYIYPSYTSLEK